MRNPEPLKSTMHTVVTSGAEERIVLNRPAADCPLVVHGASSDGMKALLPTMKSDPPKSMILKPSVPIGPRKVRLGLSSYRGHLGCQRAATHLAYVLLRMKPEPLKSTMLIPSPPSRRGRYCLGLSSYRGHLGCRRAATHLVYRVVCDAKPGAAKVDDADPIATDRARKVLSWIVQLSTLQCVTGDGANSTSTIWMSPLPLTDAMPLACSLNFEVLRLNACVPAHLQQRLSFGAAMELQRGKA